MAFSSLVLRLLTSEAERIGIASPRLLTGILDESRLGREHFWVPDPDMFEIVARARRVSQMSDLGLRLGAHGSFTAIGPSGMLLSVAESFRQALRALVHFERVARDSGNCLLLEEEGPTLTLRLAALDGPIEFQECMTEFITSDLAALLARFAGPSARFTRVLFNYPAPAHVATYAAAFGCELQFNQPRAGLVVDAALADRVQLLSQPALAETLWQLSEQQLSRLPQLRTIVDDVRDGLRVDWGARPPRIAAVARRLGLSERSLRRRLAELNVDYRSLVAERQREVASQMLLRQEVSVKEVAYGLGYYSPSAFHRAFKRWTGASPKEHRRAEH
jgi:AraC-like DNA-binding protein